MSVLYKVIEKTNPKDPQGDKLFGAQTVYRSVAEYDFICKSVSERCSMTDSDVEAVLQAFITNAVLRVMNSENLALGEWGYLTAALGTELVSNKEDYTKENIRDVKVVFVPSSPFKRIMKQYSIEKTTQK